MSMDSEDRDALRRGIEESLGNTFDAKLETQNNLVKDMVEKQRLFNMEILECFKTDRLVVEQESQKAQERAVQQDEANKLASDRAAVTESAIKSLASIVEATHKEQERMRQSSVDNPSGDVGTQISTAISAATSALRTELVADRLVSDVPNQPPTGTQITAGDIQALIRETTSAIGATFTSSMAAQQLQFQSLLGAFQSSNTSRREAEPVVLPLEEWVSSTGDGFEMVDPRDPPVWLERAYGAAGFPDERAGSGAH